MSEEKDLNEKEVNANEEALNEKEVTEETPEEVKAEPTPEEKLAELNDKYMRIHAEFDNYRRRTNKEKLDIIANANEGVFRDLLPVLDDFERALENNKNSDDLNGLKEGFNLIHNKFLQIITSKGVKEMISQGTAFDSEIHEAIANVPAPKKKDKGKVIEAVEKGYYLNDKVIRYAKVVVGQ